MQIVTLLAVLGVLILLALLLRQVRSWQTPEKAINNHLAPLTSSFNLRLDAVQQGLLTGLNATLLNSTQGLASSLTGVKDETRSRIDERFGSFATELRSAFEGLRDQLDNRISAVRADQQTALSNATNSLEGRFNAFQTQVASEISELQTLTRRELTDNRQELNASLHTANSALLESFRNLQESNEGKLTEIRHSLETKLAENIEKNSGAFREIASGIAELNLAGQKIAAVSGEIGELTDILRSPKLRGDFGEFELENMIRDVIPPEHYQIKAQINGKIADAAISLKDGLLCVDSKFPLDNYRRAVDPKATDEDREHAERAFQNDVTRHVNDIASKYIVPGLTLDFALMFVPAESVYYQICLNQELQELCRRMKVLAVSPNTLFAYFQVLAIGFRGMKLQDAAKKIERVLLGMKRDFDTFKGSFRLIGNHLQNAQNRFSDANIAAEQFSVTLDRLQFGSAVVEPEILPVLADTSVNQPSSPVPPPDITTSDPV